MQTEEGLPEDAVQTYVQVLELQGDDDPKEVAKARYQASTCSSTVQRLVKIERNETDRAKHNDGNGGCQHIGT